MGTVVVMALIACTLLAIIIVLAQNKPETSSGDSVPEITMTRRAPAAEAAAQEEPPIAQTTIYAYRRGRGVRVCIWCDGENDPAAAKCGICGQKMD